MSVIIRAATTTDQRTITALVRGARLNPIRLAWPNFLVAERIQMNSKMGRPRIVGIGQLRPHSDGTLELASLVVVPEEQGHGIGSQLVETLIRRANGKLYLMCERTNVTYYQRFGFRELLTRQEMPRSLRRIHRIVALVEGLISVWAKKQLHIAIMAHPGLSPTRSGLPE